MEPQSQPLPLEGQPVEASLDEAAEIESQLFATPPPEPNRLKLVFIGDHGLRAGWSVLFFIALFFPFTVGFGKIAAFVYPPIKKFDFTATMAFVGEMVPFLAMLAAAAIVALVERHSILDYNLAGPRRPLHFLSGLAAGFLALSALIGGLYSGGWLHFGPIGLSGMQILKYGAIWACAFVVVGFVEEGMFRCFLQATLTRGINFWWALGTIGTICLYLALRTKGNGVWGVYVIALLGLVPCLLLFLKKTPGGGFWQAAWVTSTLFGMIHTSNNGENWIGIFAAALIGFVFCVSIWATGSAWWAIGCHAAWDWGETYFYGAADSGNVAKGHYLSTSPTGLEIWSGGADGPEGSLLVIGVVLLLLAAILLIYRRRNPVPSAHSIHAGSLSEQAAS
jgi:uncharacterized protein